jgi:peptidylprolyl isomerase
MKKVLLFSALCFAFMAGCKSKTDGSIVYDTAVSAESQPVQQQAQPATQPAPPPAPQSQPEPAVTMHGDTAISSTGLKYIDMKKGTGATPHRGQTITVNYTGKLTNGKTFDSNVDPSFHHTQPFTTAIGVGQVIPGWDEGMLSMKVGGKRRLIVPASLGYGAQGMPPTIPGNSTLIFDVELLGVQ